MTGPISTKSSRDKSTEQADGRSQEAAHRPAVSGPQADILALQDAAGNQAVQGLIQAKLKIGQPGDQYEQEADRAAAEAVRRINADQRQTAQRREFSEDNEEKLQMKTMVQPVPNSLQQPSAGNRMTAEPSLEAAIQRSRGTGRVLPEQIREPMEQAFGTDFSRVRVHTDAESDRLNQILNARAFTTGHDIFLRSREYNPGNLQGQKLIAHELAHAVQQSKAGLQTQVIQLTPTDDFRTALTGEREEDRRASLIEVIDSLRLRDLAEAERLYARLTRESDPRLTREPDQLAINFVRLLPTSRAEVLRHFNARIRSLREEQVARRTGRYAHRRGRALAASGGLSPESFESLSHLFEQQTARREAGRSRVAGAAPPAARPPAVGQAVVSETAARRRRRAERQQWEEQREAGRSRVAGAAPPAARPQAVGPAIVAEAQARRRRRTELAIPISIRQEAVEEAAMEQRIERGEIIPELALTAFVGEIAMGLIAIGIIGVAVGAGIITGGQSIGLLVGLLGYSGVNSYLERREEIERGGYEVPILATQVHAAGDVVGVSQLIEAYTGVRLGTGERLGGGERSTQGGIGPARLALLLQGSRAYRLGLRMGSRAVRPRTPPPPAGRPLREEEPGMRIWREHLSSRAAFRRRIAEEPPATAEEPPGRAVGRYVRPLREEEPGMRIWREHLSSRAAPRRRRIVVPRIRRRAVDTVRSRLNEHPTSGPTSRRACGVAYVDVPEPGYTGPPVVSRLSRQQPAVIEQPPLTTYRAADPDVHMTTRLAGAAEANSNSVELPTNVLGEIELQRGDFLRIGGRSGATTEYMEVQSVSGNNVTLRRNLRLSHRADEEVAVIRMLEHPDVRGHPGSRQLDAERLVLEEIRNHLSPDAEGTIYIGTVRQGSDISTCPSCITLIYEFQGRYTGVRVVTVTESGHVENVLPSELAAELAAELARSHP
jgi:hypothetical protein